MHKIDCYQCRNGIFFDTNEHSFIWNEDKALDRIELHLIFMNVAQVKDE